MSNWPVRKRGTDGTGKVALQIDILLTAHPMAKRMPRAKKVIQNKGSGQALVDDHLARPKKLWDARGACPEAKLG